MPRSYFSIKNSPSYKTPSNPIVDKIEENRTKLKTEDRAENYARNIYNFFDDKQLEKVFLRGPV